MRTSSLILYFSPQYAITNGSFTAIKKILSTPCDLINLVFLIKSGRCCSEQVGVKAPGTPVSTIFLLLNKACASCLLTPIVHPKLSDSIYSKKTVFSILSPTPIIALLSSTLWNHPSTRPF